MGALRPVTSAEFEVTHEINSDHILNAILSCGLGQWVEQKLVKIRYWASGNTET
jgi:hypothetical protein